MNESRKQWNDVLRNAEQKEIRDYNHLGIPTVKMVESAYEPLFKQAELALRYKHALEEVLEKDVRVAKLIAHQALAGDSNE